MRRLSALTVALLGVTFLLSGCSFNVFEAEVPPNLVNFALGKGYTFVDTDLHQNYQDTDPPKLTDGVLAPQGHANTPGDAYLIGMYKGGANGLDATIVFDLEDSVTFQIVRVSVYTRKGISIWYPDEIHFSVSDDGESWTDLGVVSSPLPPNEQQTHTTTWMVLDLKDAPARGRYVKLFLSTRQKTSYIMMDEVEILGPPKAE